MCLNDLCTTYDTTNFKNMKRYITKLIIYSAIICFLFFRLLQNYSTKFEAIERDYTNNVAINLVKGADADKLAKLIMLHGYLPSEQDATFAAARLVEKLDSNYTLSTLYDLDKRKWQVSSSIIDSIGSPLYREKLNNSQQSLGVDSLFLTLDTNTIESIECVDEAKYSEELTVEVYSKEEHSGYISKILGSNKRACADVIVKLSEHYIDSIGTPTTLTIAHAKTSSSGVATFKGLNPATTYSVLPIQKGYEYGMSKGTTVGNCTLAACEDRNFTFEQQEHKIRLFDATTMHQIKDDSTLTVRSPKEFKSILTKYLALFFLLWLGCLFICYRKGADLDIILILMLLTGLCLLTMFSINDPLLDKMLGSDMATGILIGIVAICGLQYIDFTKLYQDRLAIGFDIPLEITKWLFKPFRTKVSALAKIMKERKAIYQILALTGILLCTPFLLLELVFRVTRISKLKSKIDYLLDRAPKGIGYLVLAGILTGALFFIGQEVGGMKVNLNLFGLVFQPSEISKYLIVIFMAAFFCQNATRIVNYSREGNVDLDLVWRKLKMLGLIIGGLAVMMIFYIKLGDMGPALVISATFILLYSIVKSKIELEGLDTKRQLTNILSCDLAMLIYGFLSFIALLFVGNLLGNMGVFCLIWFVLWITLGLFKKRIFESAIMLNIIISLFVFGGTILSQIPTSACQKVSQRLESRNEMCTNTWGTLPIAGAEANAGENTQVAEGLWSLASGGVMGQGLGNGSPHFTPAFHTDMILQSIGEQSGFIAIFFIILLLGILLRKSIISGYRSNHPFLFYLSLGIAIVTAVQFTIISLGSTGIIPLTGVTVPFFSYGKVSMILALIAFGIVTSISKQSKKSSKTDATNIATQNINKYNYSVSILSWIYSAIALCVCSVFFFYQFFERDETLIKPVYVNNADGIPVVEYNPRIEQIAYKMHAGDIYDRNGVLLATSDKHKIAKYSTIYADNNLTCDTLQRVQRFYPFGEHLYFMLGDFNSKLFFSVSQHNPRGYMAEARHLSSLRGYDNTLRNGQGEPVKIDIESKEYKLSKYYPAKEYQVENIQLRDYSALIPYLKAGVNSDKVSRLNNGEKGTFDWIENAFKDKEEIVSPQDIHMTIDAVLQTQIQNKMAEHVKTNYGEDKWNTLRVSAVILDASSGDLLTSAVYPLPEYDKLRIAPNIYRDGGHDKEWKAYTDMDLGLSYATAPGSTAKIVSSIAWFHSNDEKKQEWLKSTQPEYFVHSNEAIFESSRTGNTAEPVGNITMEVALNKSSNCYFVHLVNDKELYDELADIYGTFGAQVSRKSYALDYSEPSKKWKQEITNKQGEGISAYRDYEKKRAKRVYEEMNQNSGKPTQWSWAWGQNGIDASPLVMARATSSVANNGKMPTTRYLLDTPVQNIDIINPQDANTLKGYLKSTAENHDNFDKQTINGKTGNTYLGGKTGTPERDMGKCKMNDAWYTCFIECVKITSSEGDKIAPIAIAVRFERTNGKMSSLAVNLTKNVIIPTLKELGYLED